MTTSATSDYSILSKNPDLSKVTLDNIASEKARKELEAWCAQKYGRMKSERSYVERSWYLNMAFYFGRQNVQVLSTTASTNGFRLFTPQAPPWRVRLVTNKVRSAVRTDLSRLTSQKPTFTVMPANGDDDALTAASVGEELFEAFYESLKVKNLLKQTLLWTKITGNGFIKDYWDQEAEDPVNDQKGLIKAESVTPFHLFVPDLREVELENQAFVCHATVKSPEWVNYHYKGLLASGKINPSTEQAQDILQDSFLNMLGASTTQKNGVLCREFWLKPGALSAMPNGGMITMLGDTIVQMFEGWPYEHKEFPFTHVADIPSGKFYADSYITDMLPLQREYNRTRSQLVEAKNRMAKPQLMAPRGSVNPQQMTTEPGQVILYTPGLNPPQPIPLTPMPNYVLEELKTLQADMDEISGHSDFQRGQNSEAVTSATQMAFLQEQADTKLMLTVQSVEDGIEKLGRHCLSHVSQFWTTERIVQVVGEDGSYDARKFKGSDLGNSCDLRVQSGSALPNSKAGRQAFVLDLVKLGMLPADKGLEVLDLGGMERIYNDLQVDAKQVRRENMKLADEEVPEIAVNTWDNHQMHIDLHNQFRKGQEFEVLSDEVKAAFEAHVQMHQQMLAANPQAMPQSGPVGGSPTPGPAPTDGLGQLSSEAPNGAA
jgi:hypothetical protein